MLMFKLILCQIAFENPYLIERMISLKKKKKRKSEIDKSFYDSQIS